MLSTYRTYLLASRNAVFFDNILLLIIPLVMAALVYISRMSESLIGNMLQVTRRRGIEVENELVAHGSVFTALQFEDVLIQGRVRSYLTFIVRRIAAAMYVFVVVLEILAILAFFKLVW